MQKNLIYRLLFLAVKQRHGKGFLTEQPFQQVCHWPAELPFDGVIFHGAAHVERKKTYLQCYQGNGTIMPTPNNP